MAGEESGPSEHSPLIISSDGAAGPDTERGTRHRRGDGALKGRRNDSNRRTWDIWMRFPDLPLIVADRCERAPRRRPRPGPPGRLESDPAIVPGQDGNPPLAPSVPEVVCAALDEYTYGRWARPDPGVRTACSVPGPPSSLLRDEELRRRIPRNVYQAAAGYPHRRRKAWGTPRSRTRGLPTRCRPPGCQEKRPA